MTLALSIFVVTLAQLGGRTELPTGPTDGPVGTAVFVDSVPAGTGQVIPTLNPWIASNYLFRIENRWTGTYLHNEYVDARPRVGPIDPGGPGNRGWWSSYWQLVPTGDGKYEIIGRWRTEHLADPEMTSTTASRARLFSDATARGPYWVVRSKSFEFVPATIGGVPCFRIVGARTLHIETDWSNPDLWGPQGFTPLFTTSPPDGWWSSCWVLHIYDRF